MWILCINEAHAKESHGLDGIAKQQQGSTAGLVHKGNGNKRRNEVDQPNPDRTLERRVGVASGIAKDSVE